MKPLLPLAEAQKRLLSLITPLPLETVPCHDARGRCLGENINAQRNQPAADLSAMDGYATYGEGPWQVIGESRCGSPFNRTLEQGEAVQISTGALMPERADRIILREVAQLDGQVLSCSDSEAIPGMHIRKAAFDFANGDPLMMRGDMIGPAQIALALSAGHAALPVHRRPRIAIIDSGDELSSDPTACLPHQLPASNGVMLAAMAASLPYEITQIGPVADRIDALLNAFKQASDADIIVTSGGASVGDHDLIRPALAEWGASLDFWRVAIRPGKPLMVARQGGQNEQNQSGENGKQIILGLPGNPVSCFVTALLFMLPAIRALLGANTPLPQELKLAITQDLPANGPRRTFLRANANPAGVTPISETDSSALATLAQANALIIRGEHGDEVKTGTLVPVILL